jgi:hypothetical protein
MVSKYGGRSMSATWAPGELRNAETEDAPAVAWAPPAPPAPPTPPPAPPPAPPSPATSPVASPAASPAADEDEELDIAPLSARDGRRYTPREQMVVSSVLEKALVNLGVLAQVRAGDKVARDARGYFSMQKPSWRTVLTRLLARADRRQTLEQIEDLVGGVENSIRSGAFNDPRVRPALLDAVHGLRNLQLTYGDDELFTSGINVLLRRLEFRFGLKATQML